MGFPAEETRPGRKVESLQVRAALHFVMEFERSTMVEIADIKEIDLTIPGTLQVLSGHGTELLVGLGECSQQLRRWRAIHDYVHRFGKHIAWVDLSVSNNVPARFVDATLAPPAPRKITKPSRKNGMFDNSPVIVGLEIGTSKICAVVGEMNANGGLNIVGLGQSRSRGVRKGEIADASTVADDVRNAIVEAEQMADVEIRSVFLGVSGGHIRGFTNRGVHPVVSADREICSEDVEDVIKNAKAINLPAENYVLHAIRQHFLVDGPEASLIRWACSVRGWRWMCTWSTGISIAFKTRFARSRECNLKSRRSSSTGSGLRWRCSRRSKKNLAPWSST